MKVWIYKDYTKKPDMIQQIPSKELDGVKDWLDRCDDDECCGKIKVASLLQHRHALHRGSAVAQLGEDYENYQ